MLKSLSLFFVFLIYTEFEIVLAQETKNQNSFPYSKEDIENLVEKFLLKNSEIIIKALDTCKRPQQKTEKKGIQRALKQKSLLNFDPNSPVGGNLKGDVTIVEFFDYRCGVCKNVHYIVKDLVKNDGNLRRV